MLSARAVLSPYQQPIAVASMASGVGSVAIIGPGIVSVSLQLVGLTDQTGAYIQLGGKWGCVGTFVPTPSCRGPCNLVFLLVLCL